MRTTIFAIFLGLVAVALVPGFASGAFVCDPTWSICAGTDEGYAPDGCSLSTHDAVLAYTPVGVVYVVGGSGHDCSGGSGYRLVRAGACATEACADVAWFASSDGCHTYLAAPMILQDLGCPVGDPPEPGWGTLFRGLP